MASIDQDLRSGDGPEEKGSGHHLTKRLKKILDTRLENDKVITHTKIIMQLLLLLFSFQDTLEALKELSSFYTDNTLQARRNFVSKIERRSLSINEVKLLKSTSFIISLFI